MRLLRASLVKIGRRPASTITLLVLLSLLGLIYVALAASLVTMTDVEQRTALAAIFRFPEAYGSLATMLVTFSILAAAAHAGAVAGGEWTWGPFRVAVARGESRSRYILVNFAALGLLILVGFVALFAAGVTLGIVVGGLAGVERGDPLAGGDLVTTVPLIVASGWWVVSMAAAIAFATAFAMRNAVAGLVAVVALYFAEQMSAILLPADVIALLPISAGTSLVLGIAESLPAAALVVPFAATTLYALLALTVLVVVARRAEAA